MIVAWFLTTAFLATGGAATDQPGRDDKAELTRLESVWNEAQLHGDADALGRLWASDLVVTVPRMQVLGRADALAMARSGKIHFDRYETSDIQVHVHGESAIVTGHLRRTRKLGDQVIEENWQFTKAYIREDGQWRVVAFHASEAPS
jgi:ketosteroid isomerase-like protein